MLLKTAAATFTSQSFICWSVPAVCSQHPFMKDLRGQVIGQMEGTLSPRNTSSSACDFSLCPTAVTFYFLPFIYTLLFVTALPGNALSLWVFLRCISTISPIHIYLCHLSISNLFLSFTSPFLAAYYARASVWSLSDVLCQLVLHGITPVLYVNIYISLMILTWVALSRFASLIQNTHASRPSACTTLLPHVFFTSLRKVSFANTVCIMVWVISVGCIVPVTVYYSVNEVVSNTTKAEESGHVELCYSPAVELGGSLSRIATVAIITFFFTLYLLVLLSYMTVLRHIRRSRRNTNVATSQSLLRRVLRNIVVIQVILSVCLLPYHIFKPIFISLVYEQLQLPCSPTQEIFNSCHPLSSIIELKNCLFLLAAIRSSTDPVMYLVLDRSFRHQTLTLLRCNRKNSRTGQPSWSVTGSANQKLEQQKEENAVSGTMEISHASVL